jgi:hypothetical protein
MRVFQYRPDEQEGWKTYPVRVVTPGLSRCCQAPRLLVQSMKGGFATANCCKCSQAWTIGRQEFERLDLWVSCPECRSSMKRDEFCKNYGYSCIACDLFVKLADLLPDWSDITPRGAS